MTKEKEKYIKAVLIKRAEITQYVMSISHDAEYYRGKLDGYYQAIELLGESVDSIKVEL